MVATDQNWGIGLNNQLPWPQIRADMAYFRQLTTGHPVILGSRTFDSLPENFRPLPNRTTIEVSRQKTMAGSIESGHVVQGNFVDALATASQSPGADEIFLIGGGQLYKELVPACTKVYRTRIDGSFEADTHFQALGEGWVLRESTDFSDEKSGLSGAFEVYHNLALPEEVCCPSSAWPGSAYQHCLLALNTLGVCPFCVGGYTRQTQEILLHRNGWCVTINRFKPEAKTHIMLIPDRHVLSLGELWDQEKLVLFQVIEEAKKLAGIENGMLYVRQGDMATTGASVGHLHLQYAEPRPGETIPVYIGQYRP
ncbi:hypothetical protein BH11PAT4_BH11PAT4_4380 [soil metagenome]